MMLTPAITASSVSPPARITSIALAQAGRPFELEMPTGLFASPHCFAAAELAAAPSAAELFSHSRRFIMLAIGQYEFNDRASFARSRDSVRRERSGRQSYFPSL